MARTPETEKQGNTTPQPPAPREALLVVVLDPQGRILRVNPACERMLGCSFQEARGRHFWDVFLLPDQADAARSAFQSLRSGKLTDEQVSYCAVKDGDPHLISWSYTALYDRPSAEELVVCAGLDITRQEDARRGLAHLSRSPIENPNPAIEINFSGEITYANPAAIRVFPDLRERGIEHPALEGVSAAMADLRRGGKARRLRETKVGDSYYDQTIRTLAVAGEKFLHVYMTDITERKRAEAELLLKNALLEAQSEASIDGILAVDDKGQTILWNKRFAEMWNIPSELLATRNDEKILAHVLSQLKAPEQFLARVKHLYSRPSEKSRDEVAMKDGRTLDRYSAPLLFRDGSSPGRIWYFRDIAERKRSEAAVRSSEIRYRRLFEAARDGLLILDFETGMVVDVNAFLIEMLGFSREQFMGKRIWELGLFKDIVANQTHFAELREKGYIRYEDKPLETSDGRRIEVEFVSYVYPVGGKKLIQCNIRDITERKRSEAALRSSETRYRRFFEAARDGILILDAETGMVVDVNAFLIEMLGFSREQFVGKRIWELGLFKDIVANQTNFAELQEKGYIRYEDKPLETSDGRRIEVEFVSYVYPVGDKKVIQCNIRDITERKRAEEHLRQSVEKLRKMMNGTVKAMTSVLEIRDPYTAGHERRVAQLACAIAADIGVPEGQIEGIRFAGYMHDIGKIAVPAEILCKPGKITEYELGIIKTHPQFGYDILKEIDFLWPVALTTLQHHERLNGSGYPEGRSGENIILEARIMAVADVVEAMSSHRPYRPALGIEAALAEITANKGTLYDPQVVDACARLFSEKRFQFE